MIFFSLLLHFGDGLEGNEEKCSLSQSMSPNVQSYTSSLEPRKWNKSPAMEILLPIQVSKSHCTLVEGSTFSGDI